MRTENVRAASAEAQRVAARFGGSVLSSETYRTDGSVSADMLLSVPSPEFEAALDELRRIGEEVTTDSVRREDVTEEFVDLQSRERNLLAAESGLLKLYDRAEDVEDALSIQRELTGIRGQVEEVQGRIQYLQQSTASSQISVGIPPVADPPESPPAWNPALVAAKAWNDSLRVLQGLASALITALVFGGGLRRRSSSRSSPGGGGPGLRDPTRAPCRRRSRRRHGARSAYLDDENVAGGMLSALMRGPWGDLSRR